MKQKRPRNVKIIFPSTITTFAMVFGFIAIILATKNQITAGYMVMIAIIMDGLDGKVARFTNTASEFGIQYDSLSDLIAFGVAPCVIYYHFYLHQQVTDQVYYLLPIMYLVCGAVRLARFNVTASIYGKSFFTGLPIPAAAFFTVTLPMVYEWSQGVALFKSWGWDVYLTKTNFFQASVVVIIAISISMISTLRFDTLTVFWFRKYRYKPLNYAVILACLAMNLISFAVFALVISLYYVLSMYGRALIHKIHKTTYEEEEAIEEPVDLLSEEETASS